MKQDLALYGGPKTITKAFERYNTIGQEEIAAVTKVLEGGVLSKYLGCWEPDFYGGEVVRAFEKDWAKKFNIKHAVAVNSNTSGLVAAVGAIGVEPGDEVIVSPWTMSATATAILVWNAIPVFADIEDQTFNLSPESIEKNITPHTKAILVTDIFGHSADMGAILAIARKHGLKVIEDSAQAPGALYKGKAVGTSADIGVFSLNYHKHIHTGEGGVCVTEDDDLCERLQLIRNHAEAVVGDKGVKNIVNMIGFNFRMTETEAAIGIEQLKKLDHLISGRVSAARQLTEGLRKLSHIRPPVVQENCTHVYYGYPMVLDAARLGVERSLLAKLLQAEGVPNLGTGYQLLHRLPIYRKKVAYGSHGFPWSIAKRQVRYEDGICPTAERLHDRTLMVIGLCQARYSDEEVMATLRAFQKVWDNLQYLRGR